MARDYRQLTRSSGIWVPRWVVIILLGMAALWFGARIFMPPMWLVQQLDAPNSARSARLYRSVHMQHHFVVKVKEGWFWQTAHYSQPLIDDLRIDLGERLRWSEDSRYVWLAVEGQPVWGFDFELQRNMTLGEIGQIDGIDFCQ